MRFNFQTSNRIPLKITYKAVGDAKEYLSEHPLPADLVECLKGLDYVIYGGYVRDLIAKKHNPKFKEGFKDIDIMLLPRSFKTLVKSLQSHGWSFGEYTHAEKVYKHWGAVSHVYTFEKWGELRIQLASPTPFGNKKTTNKEVFRDVLLEPVCATDIRCCSVAISPNGKLLEVLPGAFKDCQDMKLVESPYASHKFNMKERVEKLIARGWKKII